MKMMTLALASLVVACTGSVDDLPTDPEGNIPPPGSTSSGDGDTFDHENDQISPWDLLQRIQEQGPPEFTSHMHGCVKMRVATIGRVLKSLGVNTANKTALSAGELYTDGQDALGAPSYANRIRENLAIQTSGSSRLFDIFAAAAPEIITAMPTVARCNVGGTAAAMFDTAGTSCLKSGVSCLLGYPASDVQVSLCTQTIAKASTPVIGKNMAVAVILAAANTCE